MAGRKISIEAEVLGFDPGTGQRVEDMLRGSSFREAVRQPQDIGLYLAGDLKSLVCQADTPDGLFTTNTIFSGILYNREYYGRNFQGAFYPLGSLGLYSQTIDNKPGVKEYSVTKGPRFFKVIKDFSKRRSLTQSPVLATNNIIDSPEYSLNISVIDLSEGELGLNLIYAQKGRVFSGGNLSGYNLSTFFFTHGNIKDAVLMGRYGLVLPNGKVAHLIYDQGTGRVTITGKIGEDGRDINVEFSPQVEADEILGRLVPPELLADPLGAPGTPSIDRWRHADNYYEWGITMGEPKMTRNGPRI